MGGDAEGLTLGRYTILREIASGGMATVYLARQQGPVGFSKPVALKRMHPHIAKDPDFSTMFYDEATLAARIQHPNVVATLDVVAHEGEVFIVMEYVDGGSLATMIRDRDRKRIQVDVGIATTIVCEVLSGLHAAHEAKDDAGHPLHIVHRDISPQNVLLGRDGLARVVDFGVAKAAVRSGVTKDQGVKGKLCYMSPEQVSGHSVDRRADIFAAAAVLFELLAGRRLFRGDDPGALIGAVIQARVPPLSDFRNDVPPGLEAVMRKGLSVDPEGRYPTALDFADALEDEVPKLASRRRISAWVEERAIEVAHRRAYREAKRKAAAKAAPPVPRPASRGPAGAVGEEGTAVMPDPRLPQPSIPEPIVDRMSYPSLDSGGGESPMSAPTGRPMGDTHGNGHHAAAPAARAEMVSESIPSERIPSENIPSENMTSENIPSEQMRSEGMATPYSQVSVAAGTSVSLPSPAATRGRTLAIAGAIASLLAVGMALAWVVLPASSSEESAREERRAPGSKGPGEDARETVEPQEDPAPPPVADTGEGGTAPLASASATGSAGPDSPPPKPTAEPEEEPKRPSKTPEPGGTTRPPPPRRPPGGTYLPDMP